MPDLHELCAAAVDAATGDEAVEAYAEESRQTEASALRGEIEGLTFAESRGRRRAADRRTDGSGTRTRPTRRAEEVRDAVRRARENAALARARRVQRAADAAPPAEPIAALYREDQAVDPDRPEGRARAGPRATGDLDRPARVTKIDAAQIGDAVVAGRDRVDDGRSGRVRADRRVVRGRLARRRGRRDADGVLVHDRRAARRPGLGGDRRRGRRSARCACSAPTKPPTTKVPIVLDQFAAMSFLGVLAGALSAEAVLKQRSLFADDGRPAGRLRAVHAGRRRDAHDRDRRPRRSTTRACPPGGPSCSRAAR